MQNNLLQDKRVVLTGGSSGIGLGIIEKLTACGAEVVFADIHQPDRLPQNAHFFKADISGKDEIDRFYSYVSATIGVPDILVSNAGRGVHEKLVEGNPEHWANILETNVMGALRTVRAFVPEMHQKGKGDIVFISSVSARHAYTYGAVYAASKAALEMVAETLRLEVQPQLRVSTIAPGVVDTNFFNNVISGGHTPESIGWGSLSPADVAEAVLFAVTRPANAAVNYMTIRPVAQPM